MILSAELELGVLSVLAVLRYLGTSSMIDHDSLGLTLDEDVDH